MTANDLNHQPMMRHSLTLCAALTLTAAPSSACITGADLDTGAVLVTEVRNMYGVFHERLTYLRRAEPGVVASTFHPQLTDDTWQNLDLGGVLSLHAMRQSGAMAAVGTFAPEVAALFPPGPDETHVVEGTWESERGVWRSTYTMETGAATTAQIGDCTYDAVPLTLTDVRTRPGGDVGTSTLGGLYIPELMLLRAPDTERYRVIALRSPRLIERFYWPFRGL